MNRINAGRLLACCIVFGASAAQADTEFEVGRLTAIFKEAGWKAGAPMPYNHEIMSAMGTFRGAAKVFTLSDPGGETLALMYVGVSYPQVNVYSQRSDCPKDARFYVRDLNESKVEDRRCVIAGGPYGGESLINNGLHYLSDANKSSPLRAPANAYFVHAYASARGGRLIDVEVVLSDRFTGNPGSKAAGEVPALLRPEVAAWADGVADAAIKGLTSFSAKLAVPAFTFSTASK